MILFDHKDYAINTNYANLLKQQPKNNKLVLYKDHEDKFRSGVIPNVVKIEDWYPNYLINCDNGIYDVFSIQGDLQRKKLKAKSVQIKFSCCSQTKTFHKDLIVQINKSQNTNAKFFNFSNNKINIKVRNFRNGDKIRIKNSYEKKLQDIFVDHKIPKFIRYKFELNLYTYSHANFFSDEVYQILINILNGIKDT